MSSVFHQRTVAKSRKQRQCDWCGTEILPGEPYHAYRWKERSDGGQVTLHLCCKDAMGELQAKEQENFSFEFGEFENGCCCERGRCNCEK